MKRTFLPSAFKHGYSEGDLDEVLAIDNASTRDWNEGFGEIGERVLFIGYNSEAELLEIIVEYSDARGDDEMIVFHMDRANKVNRRRFSLEQK